MQKEMAVADSEDKKAIVRDGYDNIAPSYLDFIASLPSPNIAWTDKLLAAIPSSNSAYILELGCGNGVPCTAHLAPRVGNITANDISSAQIAMAKRKLSGQTNIEFKLGDMTRLSFPLGHFDAVLALYSSYISRSPNNPKCSLPCTHGSNRADYCYAILTSKQTMVQSCQTGSERGCSSPAMV